MSELLILNRQRSRRINVRHLREIAMALLAELPRVQSYELGLHLVGKREMARVNQMFLGHEGSTDVITFDHSESPASVKTRAVEIHAEIYICMDDAVRQAREFNATLQSELVRYVVHGVLHLLGYDDLKPAARRRMKLQENLWTRRLTRQFPDALLSRR